MWRIEMQVKFLIALKRYKEALDSFIKVQSLIVPDAFLLFNMGYCYERLKRF